MTSTDYSELAAVDHAKIDGAIAGAVDAALLSDAELLDACERLNDAYRRGEPLLSDARYDQVFVAELRRRDPDHPFLSAPEPEPDDAFVGTRYRHRVQMLSTLKAYGEDEVAAWCRRVRSTALAAGHTTEPIVTVCAKLDGIAGYRYADALVTRGRNGWGTDVSRLLDIGVIPSTKSTDVAGELVIEQAYFDRELAGVHDLEHPRNFMAGLAGAETLKPHHSQALAAGVCRFVTYESLPRTSLPLAQFQKQWEQLMDDAQQVPYLCDGAVVSVDDPALRAELGATTSHHRWQLALKRNEIEANTPVREVRLTTGRTGRITPTLVVEPVAMYGVTITHVTAHTVAHITRHGLGPGAIVTITRGGGVIPKLLGVATPGDSQSVNLSTCPACGGDTEFDGTYLTCPHTSACGAQASRALQHFFATLGVCKGFGPSVTGKLAEAGYTRVVDIYVDGAKALEAAGLSSGIVRNLAAELERSRSEIVGDAIFIAALGVRHLGVGDSRKLLAHVPVEEVTRVTAERLLQIDGFGPITAPAIADALRKRDAEVTALLALGFNLERTRPAATIVDSPIAGKTIVFTGTMISGDRQQMEAQARRLGANVGGSVSSKTHLLVCGEKVGASKTEKASKLGVRVIREDDYLRLIAKS